MRPDARELEAAGTLPSAPPHAPLPSQPGPGTGAGAVIAGRYALKRPCATGGMGKVWLAHDSMLGRDVAVKELRTSAPGSPTQPLLEARAAAAVNHPCAVAVHDVVEDGGRLWVVMQYVDGRTLKDVLARVRHLSPAVAAHVGLCLLDALVTAHRSGVVHCDVKPSNVLISRQGDVVLIDFGIASNGGAKCVDDACSIVGSPGYLAPEVIGGEPATPASDLWSLGATLFACIEGMAPVDPADVLSGTASSALRPVRRAGELTGLLLGLLAADPAARWSARDARVALATAQDARATLSRLVNDGGEPRGSGGN
ncbi:MAG: serine/threonine-protein kinase [Frankiaceae bacterium]